MVKKARLKALRESDIDCACVIHGTAYEWRYVDTLYSMLSRHFSRPVKLHVWTEANRSVPEPYIKHCLQDWLGISGPKKSWWYKMQMFDRRHFHGRLVYFDLDVIILQNLDWMLDLDVSNFWAIKDFRHLFRGTWHGINSSCMIWDTSRFDWVWQDFSALDIYSTVRQYQGDQDFLNAKIDQNVRRYLPVEQVRSWRWEVLDGGMDFKTRSYKRPGAGSVIPPNTHVMIFHGQPKPHQLQDPVILANWY